MFRRRRKLAEITSITDKFANRFLKLAKLTKYAFFYAKRKLPLTTFLPKINI